MKEDDRPSGEEVYRIPLQGVIVDSIEYEHGIEVLREKPKQGSPAGNEDQERKESESGAPSGGGSSGDHVFLIFLG